ncbi:MULTISPECIES: PTS ascorbate transporter subunit IIC [Terrabacteria group]|uniref:PTS ascorbate transporter subunit IIC n=1 Tax=Bacillati TaxID=1783272 RepID=UPI001C6E524E|nr:MULTISPECIES: PTS ascorbate transporter subunit IIC [Terrabacteria group]MBW9213126.1 PTS transporter subunit IIC [Trueperella sp. zg.1013]
MIEALLGQVRNTALIIGLVALVGLLLQKKKSSEVISGTVKTIIGFMIFNIGSGAMSGVVNNFSKLFNLGFGVEGVTTQVEVATALALNEFGTEVALVFVLGFIFNLIIAKFTKFKAIFLTGQHFLYFGAVLALVFIALGSPMIVTVLVGGLVLGFAGAALPSLAQPFMKKITGSDDIAMGHFNLIGYTFAGWVGKLFAKSAEKEESDSSDVNLPDFLKLFRDFVFSVAVFMMVLFYVATIACVVNGHMDVVKKMAINDIWFIWPLLQGLQFAAGMSVLIYGVRQFIAEITAAFVGISEKYIPDAKPAVDCPAVFPFAPNAVLIGFVGALLGGFLGMWLMIMFKSPVVLIPAAGIAFFSGGTAGVFGNAYGGWKGALVGSFLVGIGLVVLPLVLYPAFAQLGIAEASFPNIDYNIFGAVIYAIINFMKGLF